MTWIVNKNETGFAELRKKAKADLSTLDFPTAKDEDWKYTRVAKLSKRSFAIENTDTVKSINDHTYAEAKARIVFENGFYRANLSKNDSKYIQHISSLSEADLNDLLAKTGYGKQGLFTSYNDAFFSDGVVINIPAKAQVEGIIELVFVSTGAEQAAIVKNILIANEESSAEVIMNFVSLNAKENLVNNALHALVAKKAKLIVYKIQNEKTGVSHFSSENIFQHNNSTFEIHTLTVNGDLVRNDLTIKVDGTDCHSHLGGVFIANGTMHVDNHTIVDHQKPNCTSDEIYKGIATDKGVGVFNGKIFVRRDAQKINAYQSSANILLSDDASIYAKPELEIYADDVKCSHGTTTGCIDEAALFYLQARGIGKESAQKLLVHAFANDVMEKIANESVQEWILAKLDAKLMEL
jgi:Fe-S cluster assembly protein SufD